MTNNISYLANTSSVPSASRQVPGLTVRMAIAVLSMAPLMIAFPFFERYFVKGITIGAVKEQLSVKNDADLSHLSAREYGGCLFYRHFPYSPPDVYKRQGQGIRVKTIASLFQMKLDENSSIAVLNDQEENMIDSVVARNNNQFLKNYTERYSSYNIYEDQIIVYTYSLNLYRPIFFIKDGLLSQNFLNIVRLLWSTVFFIIIICFIIFNNITFAILRPVKALNKCLEMCIRDRSCKATRLFFNSPLPVF